MATNTMRKAWDGLCLLMLAIALKSIHLDKKKKSDVVVMLTNFTDCCHCDPELYMNMTYIGKSDHIVLIERKIKYDIESIIVEVDWAECPMGSFEDCQSIATFQAIDFCESLRLNRKEVWLDFLNYFEPPLACPLKKGTYRMQYKEYQPLVRKAIVFTRGLIDASKGNMYTYTLKLRDGRTNVTFTCVYLTGYLKEVKLN